MLASTKPGSAAASGREGDGEDGWGDPIGSPLTRFSSLAAQLFHSCTDRLEIIGSAIVGKDNHDGKYSRRRREKKHAPGAHSCAAPAIGWTRETIRVKMGCRYAGVPLAGPVTWRMRR